MIGARGVKIAGQIYSFVTGKKEGSQLRAWTHIVCTDRLNETRGVVLRLNPSGKWSESINDDVGDRYRS